MLDRTQSANLFDTGSPVGAGERPAAVRSTRKPPRESAARRQPRPSRRARATRAVAGIIEGVSDAGGARFRRGVRSLPMVLVLWLAATHPIGCGGSTRRPVVRSVAVSLPPVVHAAIPVLRSGQVVRARVRTVPAPARRPARPRSVAPRPRGGTSLPVEAPASPVASGTPVAKAAPVVVPPQPAPTPPVTGSKAVRHHEDISSEFGFEH